jgi:uncharacterized protein
MKMNEKRPNPLPWYKEGLRFGCTQCGQCCTGSPGYVWVTEEDISEMATFLNTTIEKFKRQYIRIRENRMALAERKSEDNACIFLKDRKCLLYKARPKQCRTFPWWQENLNTEESWKLAALTCEGINEQAPLILYEDIINELEGINAKDEDGKVSQ